MKAIEFDANQYALMQRLLTAVLNDPKIMEMSHSDFGLLQSVASLFAGRFDEK